MAVGNALGSPQERARRVAGVMADCIGELQLPSSVLLVEAESAVLEQAVTARGVRVSRWNRRVVAGVDATPWPPAGPFGGACLRLPSARAELTMAVHAAASVLEASAPLWIYGANDEGIRSTGAYLEPLLGPIGTIKVGRHSRVLEARRPAELPRLKARLELW